MIQKKDLNRVCVNMVKTSRHHPAIRLIYVNYNYAVLLLYLCVHVHARCTGFCTCVLRKPVTFFWAAYEDSKDRSETPVAKKS